MTRDHRHYPGFPSLTYIPVVCWSCVGVDVPGATDGGFTVVLDCHGDEVVSGGRGRVRDQHDRRRHLVTIRVLFHDLELLPGLPSG